MKKSPPITALTAILIFGTVVAMIALDASGNQSFAPDFELTDLTGRTIRLSDYRGKVLFLNFWATWCPPCRAEIPDFVKTYQEQKANGLEILGISLDSKDKEAIISFANKYKINYPLVLESKDKTLQIVNDYQPGNFIPATIIIDKQGQIRHKHVGQMDKQTILDYFQQLR